VETWRGFGFVVFAGLFALLAVRQHRHQAVWLLVTFHKVAKTVTALTYASGGNVADATSVAIADGILSALLIAAFGLLRPWQRPSGRHDG